jgi:hypothetical protein
MVRTLRARINLAPTQHSKQRVVGAGFTPARAGCEHLEIVQPGIAKDLFTIDFSLSLIKQDFR